jgi:NAD(P)-dependent dehydrogenase (short-subunit alcohol dehydrogenase family)
MRIRFDGKTVVVSGVGHGFGRCIAETFAQIGARVFGCDLSAAELAETAKTGVDTQVLDLTDRAAAAAWIAASIAGAHQHRGLSQPCTRSAIDTLRHLSHRPAATVCSSPPGVPFANTAPST